MLEFMQVCGWAAIAAYCINQLGLVDVAAISERIEKPKAAQVMPAPTASPSPKDKGEISGIE